MLKGLLSIAAIVAAAAGTCTYDYSAETVTYSTDWTLSGAMAVVETTTGRLGFRHNDRIVGYYLAGQPRFVAFGCKGHSAPLISTSRDVLPACARVELVEA